MSNDRRCIVVLLANLEVGGAERVTANILNAIDQSAFDIHCIVISGIDGPLLSLLPKNLKMRFLQKKRAVVAVLSVVRAIRQIRPDLLFVNMSYLNLLVAILRPLLPLKTKILARETSRVLANNATYRMSRVWHFLYARFYKNLDVVICQSPGLARELEHEFLIPSNKLKVIRNPVDVSHIQAMAEGYNQTRFFPDDWVEAVFVGGLRKEKNLDQLIKALAHLSEDQIGVRLIGGGDKEPELKKLVCDLNLTGRVIFEGFHKNPYHFIKAADVLLLPSLYEGFPNVVLEALTLRTPVIVTPCFEGVSDLVAVHQACAVAKGFDAIQLAQAISHWMADANVGFDNHAISKIIDGDPNVQIEGLITEMVS